MKLSALKAEESVIDHPSVSLDVHLSCLMCNCCLMFEEVQLSGPAGRAHTCELSRALLRDVIKAQHSIAQSHKKKRRALCLLVVFVPCVLEPPCCGWLAGSNQPVS